MVSSLIYGGIFLSFLLGFSSVSLLAAQPYRLTGRERAEVPVYRPPIPPQKG